jgi:hypothetical protein
VTSSPEERADRTARRILWIFVAAALVLVVALVLAFIVRRTVNDEPPITVGAASDPGGEVRREAPNIGPAPGAVIADYVAARQAALAAVGDPRAQRVAVVSMVRYRTAREADAVLAGADSAGLTVDGRLVAAPGGASTTVRGPLDQWANAARADAETDRQEIERLLPTVSAGSEFIAFYQRELVRLAAVRDGADPAGAVVYGLLVTAPVATLRALAAKPEVRLVDVTDEDQAGATTIYSGVLPDDTTKVSDPALRPVPAK